LNDGANFAHLLYGLQDDIAVFFREFSVSLGRLGGLCGVFRVVVNRPRHLLDRGGHLVGLLSLLLHPGVELIGRAGKLICDGICLLHGFR